MNKLTESLRPLPGPPRDYRFPAAVRATLANGVRVAVAPMPRLPIVTVLALVDAGATRDPLAHAGLASLAARALSEGTTALEGAALTERFERLGAALDTGSDWDSALAHLTVTPRRLETALGLLGKVLTTPAFAEHDIERLKAERMADLLQRQVEPRGLADDAFAEFLYVAGSRYRLSEDGDAHTVPALTAAQVTAFHDTHYVPGATTLIFAGDVTPEQAVALAERALGGWRGTTPPPATVDDREAPGAPATRIVNKGDAPQSELRVGHGGVPRSHPDYLPIVVMNAILGGLFSSRINLNLREKNAFTYGAHSGFDWRRGAGPFVVGTAVKTEVTAAAAHEILLEIARIREAPVAPEELSLATAYLDGVFPIRYETTHAVAAAIAAAETYGLGDDYYSTYRERVRAVSVADVRRAAETYLRPEALRVLAVGDAATIREPLGQLGIGPLDVREPAAVEASRMSDAQLATRRIHTGRVIKLDIDTVRFPDGSTAEMDIIRHPGASAVIPFLSDPEGDDPQILMIRQYRYAADGELYEIPAGRLDEGETPEACAHRELREETGCTAETMSLLTSVYTTPGFTDEKIHLFMASGITRGAAEREADEFMELEPMPLSRALAMIRDGEIRDAKTALALLYAAGFKSGQ